MSRPLSRRSLLTHAAMGLPAVALGGAMFGRSSISRSAPKAAGPGMPKGAVGGPAGAASIPGDFELPAEFRPTAELVLKKARHAFATASANPDGKFTKNKLASASHKFVAHLGGPRITRARGRASTLLTSKGSKSAAAFGPYETLTLKDWQIQRLTDVNVLGKMKVKKQKVVIPKDPPDNRPRYERLEFHLNTVRCVVDTDEFDSDEILIGGQLIRPDGGVKKLDSFKVSNDFDQGEVRYYDSAFCIDMPKEGREFFENMSPAVCNGHMSDPYRGKVMVATKLDGPWPGTYGLVLLMVEEDYGGFNNLLNELYAAIKDELDSAINELGASAAEAIGGAIGKVIGSVVVWIVTELVEWIVSLFDNVDDPLQAKSWIIELPDSTKETIDAKAAGGLVVPAGLRASKMKALTFTGDGGEFKARMHWRATP